MKKRVVYQVLNVATFLLPYHKDETVDRHTISASINIGDIDLIREMSGPADVHRACKHINNGYVTCMARNRVDAHFLHSAGHLSETYEAEEPNS